MVTVSDQEFEQWAKPRGYNLARWHDGYACLVTQHTWLGWSARDKFVSELEAKIREREK